MYNLTKRQLTQVLQLAYQAAESGLAFEQWLWKKGIWSRIHEIVGEQKVYPGHYPKAEQIQESFENYRKQQKDINTKTFFEECVGKAITQTLESQLQSSTSARTATEIREVYHQDRKQEAELHKAKTDPKYLQSMEAQRESAKFFKHPTVEPVYAVSPELLPHDYKGPWPALCAVTTETDKAQRFLKGEEVQVFLAKIIQVNSKPHNYIGTEQTGWKYAFPIKATGDLLQELRKKCLQGFKIKIKAPDNEVQLPKKDKPYYTTRDPLQETDLPDNDAGVLCLVRDNGSQHDPSWLGLIKSINLNAPFPYREENGCSWVCAHPIIEAKFHTLIHHLKKIDKHDIQLPDKD